MIGTLLNGSFGSTGKPTPTGLYSPEEIASAFLGCSLGCKGRFDLDIPEILRGAHFEVIITFVEGRDPEYMGGRVGVADDEVFPGAWAVSDAPSTAPIPEPSAAILFCTGFGVVAWSARRRRLN